MLGFDDHNLQNALPQIYVGGNNGKVQLCL